MLNNRGLYRPTEGREVPRAAFVEIELGRRAKRPQLDAALAACKKHKAKLVVAKLDRLSRNVSFLLKLINSGVEVLFADLPELNGAMGRFMLTTMASVAELEAGLISERTKAALKAAKARGVRLGRHGAEVLAPQYRAEAHQRAQKLQPIIAGLKSKGLSLSKIAGELNKPKVATPRGGRWDHSSVRNVLQRLPKSMLTIDYPILGKIRVRLELPCTKGPICDPPG